MPPVPLAGRLDHGLERGIREVERLRQEMHTLKSGFKRTIDEAGSEIAQLRRQVPRQRH